MGGGGSGGSSGVFGWGEVQRFTSDCEHEGFQWPGFNQAFYCSLGIFRGSVFDNFYLADDTGK